MGARFITPIALAEELQITTRTVRRWEAAKLIPAALRIGGKVLYDREAVDRLIARLRSKVKS